MTPLGTYRSQDNVDLHVHSMNEVHKNLHTYRNKIDLLNLWINLKYLRHTY